MDAVHKMEHRWSVRKPARVEVALRREGASFNQFKTRDISMEGVFVESGPDSWPEDTFLELDLPLFENGRQVRHRVPVVVVHRSQEGMGLMFCIFDQPLFKAIEHLLYEASSTPYDRRYMEWEEERRVNFL
jgi:hypothetical protein